MKGLSFLTIARQCAGVGMDHASGHVVTETRSVSDFNKLLFLGYGDVIIAQRTSESLTIETDDDIMPHIITEVNNGTLAITFDSTDWKHAKMPSKGITYNLGVKSLESIKVMGAGSVRCPGLHVESLALDMSGAGTIDIKDLQAESVATTFPGAGHIEMAGRVTRQTITSSGLGSYGAGGLESQNAMIHINGAGGATVWATNNLQVLITGIGSVSYYGNPSVSKTVSGLGRVKSLGSMRTNIGSGSGLKSQGT